MDLIMLICGAGVVFFAIVDFVRKRRITEQVQFLVFGALLAAINLAGLLGFMTEKWVLALTSAVMGLLMAFAGILTLRSPDWRNWASWGALVLGIGAIGMAFYIVLVPRPQ